MVNTVKGKGKGFNKHQYTDEKNPQQAYDMVGPLYPRDFECILRVDII